MVIQIILISVATIFIVIPQWVSSHTASRHAERLAELREGAPERFFEERRSLETYGPPGGTWPYRIFGLAILVFSIGSIVLRH